MPPVVYRAYVLLGVLTTVALLTVIPDGVVGASAFVVAGLSPIAAIEVGVRRQRLARRPWGCAQVGLALMAVGNIMYCVIALRWHQPDVDHPVPDALYLLAYSLLAVGGFAMLRERRRSDRGGVIEASILSIVAGGLMWQYVMEPRVETPAGGAVGSTVQLLRLLFLLAAFGSLLRLLGKKATRNGALALLLGALGCTLIGFLGPSVLRQSYAEAAGWTNCVYLFAYFLVGAAAVHPGARALAAPGPQTPDRLSPVRLSLLGAALLASPVLAAVAPRHGGTPDTLRVAIVCAMVVPLVMLRIGALMVERERAEAALVYQATHDLLTGLANRAQFLERLEESLHRLREGQADDVVVLFADLDGFKQINDTLGHEAGDGVLVAAAGRFRSCVRAGDLVARFGGDEFLLLCEAVPAPTPDMPSPLQALRERVDDAFATPLQVGGHGLTIRPSVGATSVMARMLRTADEVIREADADMYRVKQEHRSAVSARPLAQVTDQ